MCKIEFRTLQNITIPELLVVFNESFSDYFIPFKLTKEQLSAKIQADNIKHEFSVGAFIDNKLIAFILHGYNVINGHITLYNGGTGVIPSKRGFAITQQMYHYLLPILKDKNVHSIQLEVISNNIPAIKSYKKIGFTQSRALACYSGSLNHKKINKTFQLKNLESYQWELLQSFWDYKPTWQNSVSVLNRLKNTNVSIGAFLDAKLVGYVICNPNSNRIQQIAVHKDYRRIAMATTLLHTIAKDKERHFSVINVAKNSKSSTAFFKSVGLEHYLEQFEMKFKIY